MRIKLTLETLKICRRMSIRVLRRSKGFFGENASTWKLNVLGSFRKFRGKRTSDVLGFVGRVFMIVSHNNGVCHRLRNNDAFVVLQREYHPGPC